MGKKGSLSTNYTFYTNAGKNLVDLYDAPENKNALLGFPQHKVALIGRLKVNKNINFNTSMIFYSSRSAITSIDEFDEYQSELLSASALLNANFTYRNLLTNGLDLSLGVFDLFNTRYSFVQPYQSGLNPLPSSGREIVLRLTYSYKK